jgi:ABC-type bacteriocin/lantibiotic exporter with double-glycine peptidase domain
MERMAPILATPVEESKEKDPPGPLSGAVEASGVTFRYGPGQPTVLENVSLSIQSGEFVAFVGPSGSGKSTLTRLILGFEEPESGGILFDGKDLRSLDATAVRRAMGVVPQHPQPMPGSLFENIVGVGEGSLDDAWDAAERAGLAEDIRRMPMGMHTIIPEGGGVLSGGQIQRLMIARVLFNRPRIILLDEATSALDNRTQAIVTESLTRLSVTRIVVAHRLSTVMTADRIHVFEGGRVVETGTYSELMAHGGLFSRLAERQIA